MTVAILLVACLVLAGAVVVLAGALRRVEQRLSDLEQRGFVTGASAPSSTIGGALSSTNDSAGAPSPTNEDREFVITRLGAEPEEDPAPTMETRLFADLVLRESVVKAASFAYGVRRGLSPANRNRIWFEMRREVKRARKQRKAEEREAIREWRARQRAAVRDPATEEDAA